MEISQNLDIGYIWNFIVFSDYWVSTDYGRSLRILIRRTNANAIKLIKLPFF